MRSDVAASRFAAAYFKGLVFLSVVALALMVALVFGNVVLRYGFNSGITISEELSRWAFVWLVFIGAIVAVRERAHLGMDAFVARLPPLGKRICAVATHVLMLVCTCVFTYGSYRQTVLNVDNAAPATGFSMAWLYAVGIVFGVSVVPLLVLETIALLTGRVGEDDLVFVRESEEDVEAIQNRREGVVAP